MMRVLAKYVTASLVVLAFAFGFSEALTYQLAGFKPLGQLDAHSLAEPGLTANDVAAARFLEERDRVQVEILRNITLGEFLRLYQLAEQPHIRRQIAGQENAPNLSDSHVLTKGRRYQITLTPPAPPAEGAEPAPGKSP